MNLDLMDEDALSNFDQYLAFFPFKKMTKFTYNSLYAFSNGS